MNNGITNPNAPTTAGWRSALPSALRWIIWPSAVIHLVLRSLVTAGVDPATVAQQGAWTPINGLGVAGAALVLLGLPVLYAKLADRTLYSVLVAPWLAEASPGAGRRLCCSPSPFGGDACSPVGSGTFCPAQRS